MSPGGFGTQTLGLPPGPRAAPPGSRSTPYRPRGARARCTRGAILYRRAGRPPRPQGRLLGAPTTATMPWRPPSQHPNNSSDDGLGRPRTTRRGGPPSAAAAGQQGRIRGDASGGSPPCCPPRPRSAPRRGPPGPPRSRLSIRRSHNPAPGPRPGRPQPCQGIRLSPLSSGLAIFAVRPPTRNPPRPETGRAPPKKTISFNPTFVDLTKAPRASSTGPSSRRGRP